MKGLIVKSFLWDLAGKLAKQIVGFIIGIILARLLTPAEFGTISMAMVLIAICEFFVNAGLTSAIIHRSLPTEEQLSSAFFTNLFMAVLLAFVVFVSAPFLSNYLKSPEILLVSKVISLRLIILGLTIVHRSLLTKELEFKFLAKVSLISVVSSGILGVWLAVCGFGVWSLVYQLLVQSLVESILIWNYSRWRPKLIFRIRALRELLSYGVNLFFAGLSNVLFQQLDSIIIARYFSIFDLGLFNRAKGLNNFAIKYSSESLNSIMFPSLVKLRDKKEDLHKLCALAENLVSFLTFGMLGWLYVTSEPLILLLLGQKWVGSIEIYKLLCLSGFVYPLCITTINIIKAIGNSKTVLIIDLSRNIIGLVGLYVGFKYGLFGYLISLVVSGIGSVLITFFYAREIVKASMFEQIKNVAIYMLTALLTVLLVNLLMLDITGYFMQIVFQTLSYVLVYLTLNYILKTKSIVFLTHKFKHRNYFLN